MNDSINPILLKDFLPCLIFCSFPVIVTGLGKACYWHDPKSNVAEWQRDNAEIMNDYGNKVVSSIGQTKEGLLAIVLK